MPENANESDIPTLFAHNTRKDWGLSVLAGERDGKRSYLFESGEERLMGSGAHDMMRKVTPTDSDQHATLMRLTALVARRQGRSEPTKAAGFSLLEQLEALHKEFPKGFTEPAWTAESRAGSKRGSVVAEAQEHLSMKALDAVLKAQQFEAVWATVGKVLKASEWVPSDQYKTMPAGEPARQLAGAVREQLYGSASLEQRVDRFVVAYETAFKKAPRWETTTALLALVFPAEYVLVELAPFRKQLKSLGGKGSLVTRPTGAAYARCCNAARVVSGKLAESGEVPQDMLDVYDFIRYTLKTKPPAPRAKAAKVAKAAKAAPAPADDSDDSEDSGDE